MLSETGRGADLSLFKSKLGCASPLLLLEAVDDDSVRLSESLGADLSFTKDGLNAPMPIIPGIGFLTAFFYFFEFINEYDSLMMRTARMYTSSSSAVTVGDCSPSPLSDISKVGIGSDSACGSDVGLCPVSNN